MHQPKLALATLACTLFLASGPGLAQEAQVHEVPVKIAGGKTIAVKLTKTGFAPAEDDKVIITGVVLQVSLSSRDKKRPALYWSFSFRPKTDDEIASVSVTNVFPSDPEVLLHADNAPRLRQGQWIGVIENGDPDGRENAWLQAKGNMFFVFRFDVNFRDGRTTTLHQMAGFTEGDKASALTHTRLLREKAAREDAAGR